MSVTHLRSIYQIKVTLNGVKPPIWRRILVPNNLDLGSFHVVLQIVLGWTNSHLHQFECDGKVYGMQDDELDFGFETHDEDQVKLSQLLKKEKQTLIYEYDFGDGWTHKILLEKILPFTKETELPVCIKGKRACPPEDCGGIWGYHELLEVIEDTNHPEHEEMLEWLGEGFDPEAFDIQEINELLAEYCR